MMTRKNIKRNGLLFLAIFFFLISCKNADQKQKGIIKKEEHTLAILPFTGVDSILLRKIKEGLQSKLSVKITQLPSAILPGHAFYKPRQRYIADSLLSFLGKTNNGRFEKIIGITTKDISTRKDPHENWGIFGLGSCPGEACVISSFRAGRNKVPGKDFFRRMVTLALHEVGHTYGLQHCPVSNCLMKDAEGKMNLDDGDSYCGKCNSYLKGKGILSENNTSEK
ncbi:MAG: hypothetical protein HOP10_10220 [Chitinophagaceae bacterium]|nr:hypothetical protein [Chitinophagaceae bacterium]